MSQCPTAAVDAIGTQPVLPEAGHFMDRPVNGCHHHPFHSALNCGLHFSDRGSTIGGMTILHSPHTIFDIA